MENQTNPADSGINSSAAQNAEPMLSAPKNIALESPKPAMQKKDYILGFFSGLLIGLMAMPVLASAKPEIYQKFSLAILPFFVIATPLGLTIAFQIAKKIAVIWQMAKFGVTGVMNVLVDFGTLALVGFAFKNIFSINSNEILISFGIAVTYYSLFKAVSFIVANINSYFWNKYWTFDRQDGKSSEFFQFFIVSIVGFVINVVIASIVFKLFNQTGGLTLEQWGLIGAAAGSVLGLVWNFLGYKFIVFKK